MGGTIVALLAVVHVSAGAQVLPGETPRPDFWMVDDSITSAAVLGDSLLVGGAFRHLGPPTGQGVVVGLTSGEVLDEFPQVRGSVLASIPDGSGGWFIGGNLESIGGVPVGNLAHLRSDGTLNPAIAPSITGSVWALARSGTTVYFGGNFSSVNLVSRGNVAALNSSTGQLSAWNADTNGIVRALAVSGGNVYIGGDFTQVRGVTKIGIAGVNGTSGQLLSWDPWVGGGSFPTVNAIAVSGNTLYIGGSFAHVSYPSGVAGSRFSTNRNNAAALITSSEIPRSWNPNPSSTVRAIAVSGSMVYISGSFDEVGGVPRPRLARVDATSGALQSWVAEDGLSIAATGALTVSGDSVYIAGSIVPSSGPSHLNVVRLDASTGERLPWSGGAGGGTVNTMSVSGGRLFMGGTFRSVGGVARRGLAALDLETGEDRGLDIGIERGSFPGSVEKIIVDGDMAYVGGSFTNVGGFTRNRIAAIRDSATDPVLPFAPTIGTESSDTVLAMATSDTAVYVAGKFATVNTQPRQNIASVNPAGSLILWNPGVNDDIRALLRVDNILYAAGRFTQIGGGSRPTLAALDLNTGAPLMWLPSTNGTVRTMVIHEGVMYVGGQFSMAGGQSRQNLAAFDLEQGALLPWNPRANRTVSDIKIHRGVMYIGGHFSVVAEQDRNGLAALTLGPTASTVLPWQPEIGFTDSTRGVAKIVFARDALYAVGVISYLDEQQRRRNIAVFDFPPGPPPNPFDINEDGAVNALDVQLVINAALGNSIAPLNADVNGDGSINAVDVQLVINAALGI